MSKSPSLPMLVAAAVSLMLALAPGAAQARDDSDSDSDSDLSRLERRRQELFLADDVLDPSFPPLEEAEAQETLQGEGKSDSVIEEPLDPDSVEDETDRKVIAGEIRDETDQAMQRDHFDDSTTPFKPANEGLGDEFKDPVEW